VAPIELELAVQAENKKGLALERDSSTEVSNEYGMSNEQYGVDIAE
jgi:hypothetical protein